MGGHSRRFYPASCPSRSDGHDGRDRRHDRDLASFCARYERGGIHNRNPARVSVVAAGCSNYSDNSSYGLDSGNLDCPGANYDHSHKREALAGYTSADVRGNYCRNRGNSRHYHMTDCSHDDAHKPTTA